MAKTPFAKTQEGNYTAVINNTPILIRRLVLDRSMRGWIMDIGGVTLQTTFLTLSAAKALVDPNK